MCQIDNSKYLEYQKNKIQNIDKKISQCEFTALKIKAVNFVNMQSFDMVHSSYDVGEVYRIEGVGYTVITDKTDKSVDFVVIMHPHSIWEKHIQDVDKRIEIKQGVYLDLLTGKEYRDNLKVKAFDPSYFKSIGEEDLVLKGVIFKP